MMPLRIGTRDSRLALWQAETVADMLRENGIATELVPVKSEGDLDLQTPLYEMGIAGIFTRSLDMALLDNRIDIAVHSYKDVPTIPANGLSVCAVLKRGNYSDLLVYKESFSRGPETRPRIIATSSIRRKAQWLHRFPSDTMENLRGNVNTRMEKLEESRWDAAIFAAAGLERIGLRPEHAVELDWMLPAPAQGAIAVMCRQNDTDVMNHAAKLNDEITAICTAIERSFMREMMGGCSVPVSALALCDKKEIYFRGSIVSMDGRKKAEVEKFLKIIDPPALGKIMALELLARGGSEILTSIRNARKH